MGITASDEPPYSNPQCRRLNESSSVSKVFPPALAARLWRGFREISYHVVQNLPIRTFAHTFREICVLYEDLI